MLKTVFLQIARSLKLLRFYIGPGLNEKFIGMYYIPPQVPESRGETNFVYVQPKDEKCITF